MSLSIGNESKPSYSQITFNWLKKPSGARALIFKPGIKTCDWAEWIRVDIPSEAKQVRKQFSRGDYVVSCLKIPKKIRKLKKTIIDLNFKKSSLEITEKIVRAFKYSIAILNTGTTGLEISASEGLIVLSVKQIKVISYIGFLGCVALTLKTLFDMREIFSEIFSYEYGQNVYHFYLIKIICKICSLITGIFGMIAFAFGGELIAKWILLSVSTCSLSFLIIKHYYKRLNLN